MALISVGILTLIWVSFCPFILLLPVFGGWGAWGEAPANCVASATQSGCVSHSRCTTVTCVSPPKFFGVLFSSDLVFSFASVWAVFKAAIRIDCGRSAGSGCCGGMVMEANFSRRNLA